MSVFDIYAIAGRFPPSADTMLVDTRLTDDQPLVFLAVDTPRRDPKDIIFVNPADGTPGTFIQTKKLY